MSENVIPLLFLLLAAATQENPRDVQLRKIINAYGGRASLSLLSQSHARGRFCVAWGMKPGAEKKGSCSDLQIWKRDGNYREEFDSIVRIYKGNKGFQYIEGDWLTRFLARLLGTREGQLSPSEARTFGESEKRSLSDFLLRPDTIGLSFDGYSKTITGESAATFSFPERGATVRLLFDRQTNLCVQRTIVRSPKDISYVLFGDFRDVRGLKLPHRIEVFLGKQKMSAYLFDQVEVGGPIHASYFDFPTIVPLWVAPSIGVAFLVIVVALLRTWWKRKSQLEVDRLA